MSAEATHITAYTLTVGVVIFMLARRRTGRTMAPLLLLLLVGLAGVPALYAITGHERPDPFGDWFVPVSWALLAGVVVYIGSAFRGLLKDEA